MQFLDENRVSFESMQELDDFVILNVHSLDQSDA